MTFSGRGRPIAPAVALALALATAGCLNHARPPGAASPAATRAPQLVIWDIAWMTRVKAQIAAGDGRWAAGLARLRQEADRALAAGPFSVMDKKMTPPSGDKHDYMSVAPYWWPDPARPDGLPYLRKDGERNPARNSSETDNASESAMAAAVEALGLAYFFTDHQPYADHALKLLRVWFIDPATRMNPNLSFAQAIPGVTPGRPAGVIDTVDLVNMLEAVELLGQSPGYTAEDDRALRDWFGQYLDWLSSSEIGQGEKRATNNHGSWYDVQVCRFALFAGRAQVAREVVAAAGSGRIAAQIEPDGRQPRELSRTRSFHYSGFNLSALFALASIASRAMGTDLFAFQTADGRSLRRALELLLPYLDPAATWPHTQLGGRDPAVLIPVLWRARRVYGDERYERLLRQHLASELADHRIQLLLP
jgi:hypothetical protein